MCEVVLPQHAAATEVVLPQHAAATEAVLPQHAAAIEVALPQHSADGFLHQPPAVAEVVLPQPPAEAKSQAKVQSQAKVKSTPAAELKPSPPGVQPASAVRAPPSPPDLGTSGSHSLRGGLWASPGVGWHLHHCLWQWELGRVHNYPRLWKPRWARRRPWKLRQAHAAASGNPGGFTTARDLAIRQTASGAGDQVPGSLAVRQTGPGIRPFRAPPSHPCWLSGSHP